MKFDHLPYPIGEEAESHVKWLTSVGAVDRTARRGEVAMRCLFFKERSPLWQLFFKLSEDFKSGGPSYYYLSVADGDVEATACLPGFDESSPRPMAGVVPITLRTVEVAGHQFYVADIGFTK